ncbi:MAG TPA: MBOAT family protein [Gemmataceae bacterium]|nr:MBOAT family protein [Gemmataceae bacterium]
MVFSSLVFLLLFLPVTVALYYLSQTRYRNVLLCTASVFFYLTGSGIQILLLLLTAAVDYVIGWRVYQSRYKKAWLLLSLTFNIGFLAYFKYANFLIDNWNGLVEWFNVPLLQIKGWKEIVLPLGISFYTFETMAYVIDIYMGRQKPARTILDYAMYITMFPHLIAGPIYRFKEIHHEIDPEARSKANNVDQMFYGLYVFCLGLGKKIFFANVLGQVADYCFGTQTTPGLIAPSFQEAWIGALAYTFQIYFDFSGYSDMAIGLGMIFGFHFPQNFDRPYTASSITDFWRRWHMTLSRWFRDYLYIPLGGNRGSRLQTVRNLMIVFLLCGLWHGAKWTFVLWGMYHGLLLILERGPLGSVLERMPRVAAQAYTFLLTVVGWVLFRAETLGQIGTYLKAMFSPLAGTVTTFQFYHLTRRDTEFMIAFCFAFLALIRFDVGGISVRWPRFAAVLQAGLVCCVAAFTMGSLATGTFNPFIYFRF